jgi:hypothetical protein
VIHPVLLSQAPLDSIAEIVAMQKRQMMIQTISTTAITILAVLSIFKIIKGEK